MFMFIFRTACVALRIGSIDDSLEYMFRTVCGCKNTKRLAWWSSMISYCVCGLKKRMIGYKKLSHFHTPCVV